MNTENITTSQPNNSLAYPVSFNINTTQPEFYAFRNQNVTKSTPIMNANRSMHPLLLPNYSHISPNTSINPSANTQQDIKYRTMLSNNLPNTSDSNICWPKINNTNDHHISLTPLPNLQPSYQQGYVTSNPSQLRNISYSSITSFPTDTPISITKSYSILGGGDTTKRASVFSTQNMMQLPYPPYNNVGEKKITHDTASAFKTTPLSSVSPTFFNRNFPQSRKRQRLGPSCDTCRSRKVKCDAKIEILYEDDRIINEISQKLIYILTPLEVEELSKTVLRYHVLPEELFVERQEDSNNNVNNSNSTKKHYRLLKHINKIVLFQPCSSCVRLKNHRKKTSCANKWKVEQCSFSRGLTKNDTNIFNEIHRLTGKNLDEMTVDDFRTTGLQVSFPLYG